MNSKAQSVKNLLLVLGMAMALLLINTQLSAQTQVEPAYQCTPCGCSQDNVIVHAAGNCSECGMKLININNPSEGLNYTNLYNYQVCDLIANTEDLLILDVRSEGEYTQRTSQIGRFKGAINIPINQLEKSLKELAEYKGKPILVYCSISARSPRASQLLADAGFTDIHNLIGGLNAWNQAEQETLPCQETYVERK
ncbi:rhodanese-like domain-containing protein [Roseivirga sp.]|uniref:rhodanese-like domain-containing protein n=1 Tax=Roseivirga sp. TaxID=1964215 RepID=UPI003B51DF89